MSDNLMTPLAGHCWLVAVGSLKKGYDLVDVKSVKVCGDMIQLDLAGGGIREVLTPRILAALCYPSHQATAGDPQAIIRYTQNKYTRGGGIHLAMANCDYGAMESRDAAVERIEYAIAETRRVAPHYDEAIPWEERRQQPS